MTLLDELNDLLEKSDLNIPAFRRSVSRGGQNQQWLQKNLKRHPDCPWRITELVALPLSVLVEPVAE